jgi:serine protease Do
MTDRKSSFFAILLVIGASVVFGMIVGGKLNAPQVVLASGDHAWLEKPRAATPAIATIDFADIVEEAMPAVVAIRNITILKGEDDPHGSFRDDEMFRFFFGPRDRDQQPQDRRSDGFGSGFIVSPDGYILTNHHVVDGATKLVVENSEGEEFEARVIGSDPNIDLALIKIDPDGKRLPTVPLGDSNSLRVGEWVIAIGNPLGLEYTVTAGVVSAKSRNLGIGATLPGVASFIQTDAAINKGNSGGPLLNARGEVVGINTAISRGDMTGALVEGVGFALPIDIARDAAEQLLETGSVERGFLGITMNQSPLDEAARDYLGLPGSGGVLIVSVSEWGPAYEAGVRPDDVILRVDGKPVKDNSGLLSRIATRRPGETVSLEIFRGGEVKKIDVVLMSRSDGIARSTGGAIPAPSGTEEPEIVPAAGLGIEVEPITDEFREQWELAEDAEGVVVAEVDVTSDAAEKLVPRMIITAINDQPIRNIVDWNRTIRDLEPGEAVKLQTSVRNNPVVVFLKVPEPDDE